MANQNLTKNESQREQEKRSQSKGTLARRGGWYDPLGLSLSPTDFLTNPFSMMRRMTEEMDRMFRDTGTSGSGSGSAMSSWVPAVEISERDNNYIVKAELPGLKPEDVKIEATEDALILEGERKYEHEEEKGGVRRSERRYGQFYRSIPLPEGADVDQIKAKFENGVLEVSVPTPQQQSSRRQIQIETSQGGGAQKSGQAKSS